MLRIRIKPQSKIRGLHHNNKPRRSAAFLFCCLFNHTKDIYSPRKLIPVNVKSLGDYLLLKRVELDLSQAEVAKKTSVSVRTLRKWEHGIVCPNEDHWQVLKRFLNLDDSFLEG
jgi:hypothetical protein